MKEISIIRPEEFHIEKLHSLFQVVITDTFEKEGVGHDIQGMKGEVEEKKRLLKEDIESNGNNHFFLIACYKEEIVGSISYGPCGKAIQECSKGKLNNVGEIGTVYIHPEYQKKGIGTLLLNSIFIALLSRNIEEFCLDSGYKSAQKFWEKKLGTPDIIVKDYWGEGFDHMIWYRKLRDFQIFYNTY